jgi:hypothetical protein
MGVVAMSLRHGPAQAGSAVRAAAVLAALLIPAAALGPGRAEADTGRMTEKEIRQAVIGKRIYLQTPLGGEFPLNYRKNGKVDGDGKALGLGRFMSPADSGRWWIESGQLCQQWTEWYDGKPQCFVLQRTGESTLYWKRDDGLEGEARIGR